MNGPIVLPAHIRTLVKRHGGTEPTSCDGNPHDNLDHEEIQVLQQMAAKKCKVGTEYYYFFTGEDADTSALGTNVRKVQENWAAWVFEGTELTAWEDMGDNDLEDWFEMVAP